MDTLKEIKKIADELEIKTCTKCGKTKHGDEIYFNRSWCVTCIREYKNNYSHEYYKKNKKEILKKDRDKYHANPEIMLKYQKEYAKKNKAMISARQKQYRENNKEKLFKYKKEYDEKNKDSINERRAIYREKNKKRLADEKSLKEKENRKNMTDAVCIKYIKYDLGINKDQITPEMIEIKRAQMTLRRLIK